MPDQSPRRYSTFLSYRHADNREEGRRWAEWLHQALETYDVPRDLIGKLNLRGDPTPLTLYPVFRDEAELPANAELSAPIRAALENSDTLIVLCSPRAVESRFVADEIRTFKELGKADRILALMLEGEPNADDPGKIAAGLDPRTECLPEPLRFGVANKEGTVNWSVRTEPIAADVRPGGLPAQGYTSAAAYRTALEKSGGHSGAELRRLEKDYAARLDLARLKIISGIIGVPLGTLTKRDAAYRARKFRRLASIFGLLLLLAVVAGGVALWQRAEARRQRSVAISNAQRAVEALANSDFREGVNRLGKPETSAEGLALLARSARLGHLPAAESRLWTAFQQRQFWLDIPVSAATLPPKAQSDAAPPDPKFATVIYGKQRLKPEWFSRSADGRVCVTIVNGSIVDGPVEIHHFRIWRSDGTPITPWLSVSYTGENYLKALASAHLSADGHLVAVVAYPWREPQYIEVWDTAKKKKIGPTIEATGSSPHHQNVWFNEVRFLSDHLASDPDAALLLTVSQRGDASLFAVSPAGDDADDTGFVELRGRNRHSAGATIATVDTQAGWLMSASEERQIMVSEIANQSAIGHPFIWPHTVEAIGRVGDNHLRVIMTGNESVEFGLSPRMTIPPPAGLRPRFTADGDPFGKPDDDEGLSPSEIKFPKVGDVVVRTQTGTRFVRLLQREELAVFENQGGSEKQIWTHRFAAPVVHVRFARQDAWLVAQTGAFTTEVWDVRTGQRIGRPIEEARLFAQDQTPTRPLPSMIDPQQNRLLTRSFFWDPPDSATYWFGVWDITSGLPVIDRMKTINEDVEGRPQMENAELSEDGNLLLLSARDENVVVRECIQLTPPAEVRAMLPDAAEGLGGLKIGEDGAFFLVPDRPEKLTPLFSKWKSSANKTSAP